MNVEDLDGNEYNLRLKNRGKYRDKSSYHLKALEMVKSIYPTMTIIEELPFKIRKGKTLYWDIVVVEKKLFIEVQGESHYKFNNFHHKDKIDFLRKQNNDNEKKEWCRVNGFDYAALAHFEDREVWEYRLRKPIPVEGIKVHAGDTNENETCIALSDSFRSPRNRKQYILYKCLSCKKDFSTEANRFIENKKGCTKCSGKSTRKGTIAKNGKKRCCICQTEKSVDEFCKRNGKNKNGSLRSADGYNHNCKSCKRGMDLRKYGYNKNPVIALEEYEYEIKSQNYCCIFCDKYMEKEDRCIHHCHDNGTRHGIAHGECNRDEGFFKKAIISKRYIPYYFKHNPELIQEIKNQISECENAYKRSYKHIRVRNKHPKSSGGL